MRLLITGGTGFLGSYLARHTLNEGGAERVVLFDRYPDRARIADILDRVELIEGDVTDHALISSIIADHGIDHVAHFAFILGSPATGQMLPYVEIQASGAAGVFEAARLADVRRVLFASSVAAYGAQASDMLHEDLVPNPQDLYGATKAWAESLGRHYTRNLGLEVVTLRYGSTYGLGRARRGSYASGLLPLPQHIHYMARVEEAVRGRPIVMPHGDALADWTYAADGALAAWLALTADHLPHHLYNVGAERLPIARFTSAIAAQLPEAIVTIDADEPPGNPHKPMATDRLRADLGFSPRYSIEAGVADYIERTRSNDAYLSSRG